MLRLLLAKQVKTPQESELMSTMLESYSSYKSSGRRNQEIACLIARDFMVLYQSSGGVGVDQQQQQQQPQQQMKPNGQQLLNVQSMQHFSAQPSQSQVMQQHQQQQHANGLLQLNSMAPVSSTNLGLNQSTLGGSQQSFIQGGPTQFQLNRLVQSQALLASSAGQNMQQNMQQNNSLQLQNLRHPGNQQMNPIMMGTAFHPPHQHR